MPLPRLAFALAALSATLWASDAALIIGNNAYEHLDPLHTAVNDAEAMERLLRIQYGFQTKLLLNASRYDIMSALFAYRNTLDRDSSLLIYYAGHGYRDKAANKAYWLPVKAQMDNPSEWISADDITTALRTLAARHVLVVSDSCYSGTFRGVHPIEKIPEGDGRAGVLQRLRQSASRELLASGGNEPVTDEGSGDHSVFAGTLLGILKKRPLGEFTVQDIVDQVRNLVKAQSEQVPVLEEIYNSIREANVELGSFVFNKISDASADEPDNPFLKTLETIRRRRLDEIFDRRLDETLWLSISRKTLLEAMHFESSMGAHSYGAAFLDSCTLEVRVTNLAKTTKYVVPLKSIQNHALGLSSASSALVEIEAPDKSIIASGESGTARVSSFSTRVRDLKAADFVVSELSRIAKSCALKTPNQ